MTPTTKQTMKEIKQLQVISKASYDLLKIVGKHSTLWNYPKMETVEKLTDLFTQQRQEILEEVTKMEESQNVLSMGGLRRTYMAGFVDAKEQVLKLLTTDSSGGEKV